MVSRLFPLAMALAAGASAQVPALFDSASVAGARQMESDRRASIADAFDYHTGTVALGQDLATLRLPEGYRYLNPADADRMLSAIWGNPPGEVTLGLIVPAGVRVTEEHAWVILLRHDTLGHVEDAGGLPDPDAVMEKYLEVEETRNLDRMGANNPRKDILGWMVPPAYAADAWTLHWATEWRSAWYDGKRFLYDRNRLDYQARILGRRGMIRMEAAAFAEQREALAAGMAPLLECVAFNPGSRHSDFDPAADPAAGLGLAGLITGLPVSTPEATLASALRWVGSGFSALLLVAGYLARRRLRKQPGPKAREEASAPEE